MRSYAINFHFQFNSRSNRRTISRNSRRSDFTRSSFSSARRIPSRSSTASSRKIVTEKGTRHLAFEYANKSYDSQIMHGYESNSITGPSNLSLERRSGLEKNNSSSGYLNHNDPERWHMQRDASDAFSRAFNKNVKHDS